MLAIRRAGSRLFPEVTPHNANGVQARAREVQCESLGDGVRISVGRETTRLATLVVLLVSIMRWLHFSISRT